MTRPAANSLEQERGQCGPYHSSRTSDASVRVDRIMARWPCCSMHDRSSHISCSLISTCSAGKAVAFECLHFCKNAIYEYIQIVIHEFVSREEKVSHCLHRHTSANTVAPKWQSTSSANKQIEQQEPNKAQQHHQTNILSPSAPLIPQTPQTPHTYLPPHLALQMPTPHPKVLRRPPKPIRLVDQ